MRLLILFCLALYPLFAESLQTPGVMSGGIFVITSKCSSKALTVEGVNQINGSKVYQWKDTGSTAQQWRIDHNGDGYYRITSMSAQKLLDVKDGSLEEGGNIHVWSRATNINQLWKIVDAGGGWFKLVAKVSGLCLNVTGAGTSDGTYVQQWHDDGSTAQRWRLTLVSTVGFNASPLTPGGYVITSNISNLLLSIPAGSTGEGVNVKQNTNLNATWQRWTVEDGGDNSYVIRSNQSNKVLSVANDAQAEGAKIQQKINTETDYQKWKITPSPGNWMVITSVATGKAVGVAGVSVNSGAPVIQSEPHNGANQLWKFTPFYNLTLTSVPLSIIVAQNDIVSVSPQKGGLVSAYEACGVATVKPFTISVGSNFILPTNTPGYFTYQLTNTLGDEIGLIEATVVSTNIGEIPIADQIGYTRQVQFNVAPRGAPITFASHAASTLSVSAHTESVSVSSLLLTPYTAESGYVVASINGPQGWRTISRRKVDSFKIETNAKSVIHVYDLLEDGTQVAEATLTMIPLIRDLSLKMTTFVSGVTFLDGTTLINGSTNQFAVSGNSGLFPYFMLRAPTGHANFCHTFTLYQSGQKISRGW